MWHRNSTRSEGFICVREQTRSCGVFVVANVSNSGSVLSVSSKRAPLEDCDVVEDGTYTGLTCRQYFNINQCTYVLLCLLCICLVATQSNHLLPKPPVLLLNLAHPLNPSAQRLSRTQNFIHLKITLPTSRQSP